MKKQRKLNLKKISIANINAALKLKGGKGNPITTILDTLEITTCPISLNVNDDSCHTTDGLGSRDRQHCNHNC